MSTSNGGAMVHIVDDDEAVRGALSLLMHSVGLQSRAYASAEEFLAGYRADRSGCLLLDVRMPGMSGTDLQVELNRRGDVLPVIFVTGHGDVPMAVEAMQHGAFDFLQKPFRDQELLERVNRALEHDRLTRKDLAEKHDLRQRIASLTPRETEVMRLVAAGKANKVIGAELGVSQRTVEIHRAHVMEKMRARSLAALVRMVMDAGEGTAA